MSSAYAKDV